MKIAESRAFVCPPAATIAPCTCSSYLWGTGVELNCYNQGLTDSQLSSKLNLFLSTGISPLLSLNAASNGLTKVPDLLPKFASLWIIDLSNNQITALPPGAFSYPLAKYLLVYLQDNQIKSIPYDSFNSPRAGTAMIYLNNNTISSIPISLRGLNVKMKPSQVDQVTDRWRLISSHWRQSYGA